MMHSAFCLVMTCVCYLCPYLCSQANTSQIAPPAVTPVTLDGIIDQENDDTVTFTPDGATVFFHRSSGANETIMISHRINRHWSPPQPAAFSGQWHDKNPLVAPDGSYLLFNSDRPTSSGGKALLQNYFAGGSGPGANIWRVDRKGNQWGDPVWLGPVINSDVFIDFPSVAADGTLYFMRFDAATKIMHLLQSRYEHGTYLAPELVTLGDPAQSIHDPAVAPDQSFIVFDYGKVKGGLGRLSLAFREGNHWSKPIDLGDDLNKDLPWGFHLDADKHTIYFTGKSGIQKFSLEPWLNAHQRKNASPS
jgi:Tol biopolymer transport system component